MRPWRALRSVLGVGPHVGAESETAGDDEQDAGVLVRREGPPQRPARVSGPALRGFETLDTILPHMATTIARVRPMIGTVLDDDLDDDYDDRALLRELRALAHQAGMVRVATNTLGAGIDLLESDELEELV